MADSDEWRVPGASLERRRAQGQEAGGVELGGHVGQLPLDGLMRRDRLAERAPLARIGQRIFERRARDAQRPRRDADAPAVKRCSWRP